MKIRNAKIIQSVIEKLNEVIGDFEPEKLHWVESEYKDVDESEDRCYECAKKKAEELTERLKVKVFVSGGSLQESDTCAHCQDCGELLEYTLTDCGVESELDHYLAEDSEIDFDREEAYHLLNVLECYPHSEHNKRIIELAKKIQEKQKRLTV